MSLINSKIIAITKTWCKDLIGNAEICLQNYVLCKWDRCNTTGGGFLLYVHDSLQSVSCNPLNDLHINEAVQCAIQLRNEQYKMLIGIVYHSPNSSFENNSKVINLIPNLSEYVGHSYYLLMGDLDYPNINQTAMSSHVGDRSLSACFLNACGDGLLQTNQTQTWPELFLVDLVFNLNTEMIEDGNINHLSPLDSSDHEVLLWNVIYYPEVTGANFERKKWNYVKYLLIAMLVRTQLEVGKSGIGGWKIRYWKLENQVLKINQLLVV